MAGLGVIAQSNTSTYIVAGLDTWITENSDSVVVDCYLYFKRTNTYSGVTYSTGVTGTITIDGSTTSGTFDPQIPGNTNDWQGPYIHAQKSFTGSARTITVSWSTSDSVTAYFGGSGSASVMLPPSNTPPTGLYMSNLIVGPQAVTATIGVTDWGNGGTTAGRYLELSVCQNSNIDTRSWNTSHPGNNLSAEITVSNSSATPYQQLTITPNQHYYLTQYATNGAANTGNTSFTEIVTPCEAITVGTVTPDEQGTTAYYTGENILFSYSTGAGYCDTVIMYRVYSSRGGWSPWWSIVPPGTTDQTLNVSGLAFDSDYTVEMKISQTKSGIQKSESEVTSVSFHTIKQYKFYGSVNNTTKSITNLYGSVNGQTKLISKLYGSVDGVTKRIF